MKRSSFIKNIFLATGIYLLPKCLRPEDEAVEDSSRYIAGVDPCRPDGDYAGIILLKKRRGGVTYMVHEGRIKDLQSIQEWVHHAQSHFPNIPTIK